MLPLLSSTFESTRLRPYLPRLFALVPPSLRGYEETFSCLVIAVVDTSWLPLRSLALKVTPPFPGIRRASKFTWWDGASQPGRDLSEGFRAPADKGSNTPIWTKERRICVNRGPRQGGLDPCEGQFSQGVSRGQPSSLYVPPVLASQANFPCSYLSFALDPMIFRNRLCFFPIFCALTGRFIFTRSCSKLLYMTGCTSSSPRPGEASFPFFP